MKLVWLQMGMPITLEIIDQNVKQSDFKLIHDYFSYVDHKFSPYKDSSEVSLYNAGKLSPSEFSSDFALILTLAEATKNQSFGFFDIMNHGKIDPSGIVKGWAIYEASKLLKQKGFKHFYLDAGGDIETSGQNAQCKKWSVGIKNPFNTKEIVKAISLNNQGIATSGTYNRGSHIYNPKNNQPLNEIVSLTVIGPNVYEADRFATAAFAMGKKGINFIESLVGFEAYQIDNQCVATMTSNFEKFSL